MRKWRTALGILPLVGTVAFVGAITFGASAMAEGRTSAQCGQEFDQCQKVCNEDPDGGAAKRAPCVAKCSGLYAACDAGVAYEKAKPWIEEQAKKTKRFFDELIDKYGTKNEPGPPKKDKSNSI